jgi:trimeric autotransporter adhesin
MSTKTSIKRIAAVAAVALTLGGFSAVSAHATGATAASASTNHLVGSASATPFVVGAAAATIKVPVTFTGGSAGDTVTVSVRVSSAPSGSTALVSNGTPASAVTESSGSKISAAVANGNVTTDGSAGSIGSQVSNLELVGSGTGKTLSASHPISQTQAFSFTPDKAGTYVFAIIDDTNGDGVLSSGETASYLTVTAATAPAAAATLTAVVPGTYAVYSSAAGTTNGAWVKVQVTDGSAATVLSATQQVIVTVPSTATIVAKMTGSAGGYATVGVTGASYALSNTDFSNSGVAYLQITNSAAGTATVTAQVGGATTVNSLSLVYAAVTAAAHASDSAATGTDGVATWTYAAPIGSAGTVTASDAATGTAPAGSSITFVVGSTTSGAVVPVRITAGTGDAGLFGGNKPAATRSFDLAVTVGTTASTVAAANGFGTTEYTATVTVPAALTVNGDYSYKSIQVTVGTAITGSGTFPTPITISGVGSSATTLKLVSPTAASVLSAAGATQSALLNCVDNFGAAKANQVITPSLTASSRNYGIVLPTYVTDASGNVTISYKDASTSTTNLTDVLQVTGCNNSSATTVLTVNYTVAANYGVSKVAWTAGGAFADTTSYVGATQTNVTTGDAVSSASLTFKVTDANGALLAGVPVTFSLAGNAKSAIQITKTVNYGTVYTAADGTATTNVVAWGPGTSTVTATAGAAIATGYITWINPTGDANARNIALTASNGVLHIVVTDRFGNGVSSANVALSRTGTGFFGVTGSSSTSVTTGSDGTVDVQFNGDATVTAKLGLAAAQAFAPAGQYDNTAGDTYTAAIAGTTVGIGSTFAPAGNYSATVTTTAGSDATTTAAQAAVDAANEATDAANAATDAANNAMDSADAAQQAALDAGDKADAALAAVTDLATKVSAIASQIASLSALVKKIAAKVKA